VSVYLADAVAISNVAIRLRGNAALLQLCSTMLTYRGLCG